MVRQARQIADAMNGAMPAAVMSSPRLSPDGRTVAVHVPMTFRKRGGRKVVIAPADTPAQPTSALAGVSVPGRTTAQPGVDAALVKTLAQAFRFQRHLDEGRYATVGDLAQAEKLDKSFVARVLRLTLLAPDIVEAILDGRQSEAVQRHILLRGFSLAWEDQKRDLATA